jgi:hypothetical protein
MFATGHIADQVYATKFQIYYCVSQLYTQSLQVRLLYMTKADAE